MQITGTTVTTVTTVTTETMGITASTGITRAKKTAKVVVGVMRSRLIRIRRRLMQRRRSRNCFGNLSGFRCRGGMRRNLALSAR